MITIYTPFTGHDDTLTAVRLCERFGLKHCVISTNLLPPEMKVDKVVIYSYDRNDGFDQLIGSLTDFRRYLKA